MTSCPVHPFLRDGASRGTARRPARRGFTIVEMLVTVAIIVILITILIVALSQAARGAQRSRTQFLMTSINQGLAQFKADHGYAPPVLGRNGNGPQFNDRDARDLPVFVPSTGFDSIAIQNYRSVTTLAEYLLGYGDRSQDGYGRVGAGLGGNSPGDRELPALGFRAPGDDGIWGAWTNPRPNFPAGGQLGSRNPGGLVNPVFGVNANSDVIAGKVYGPYIDLKDERLIGCVTPTGQIFLPGEGGFDPALPKVIVDYWGQPIVYFRRLHLPRDPRQVDQRTSLGDVFVLRPWSFRQQEDVFGIPDFNTVVTTQYPDGTSLSGDGATTRALRAAEFALFSAGADRQFDASRRVDVNELNRDNIVELNQ